MFHCVRLLILISVATSIFGALSTSKDRSNESFPSKVLDDNIRRTKRSLHFNPYRNDLIRYANYFSDDADIDPETENGAERKKRIAYFYPQRSTNFVAFDEDNDAIDNTKKKRNPFYYPQYAYSSPMFTIDDESEGTGDRKKRVVPYYFPRFGSNNYKSFLKRFSFLGKRKRSAVDQDTGNSDEEIRRKRANDQTLSETKKSLLLEDLANGDVTSFGYDK